MEQCKKCGNDVPSGGPIAYHIGAHIPPEANVANATASYLRSVHGPRCNGGDQEQVNEEHIHVYCPRCGFDWTRRTHQGGK